MITRQSWYYIYNAWFLDIRISICFLMALTLPVCAHVYTQIQGDLVVFCRQAIPIRRNMSRCDYGLVPRDNVSVVSDIITHCTICIRNYLYISSFI